VNHRDRTFRTLEHVGKHALIVQNRLVGTNYSAGTAIDAETGFDEINLLGNSGNRAGRTALLAGAASGAILGDDLVGHFADPFQLARAAPARINLLAHLVNNLITLAVLDKLIIAAGLLERDVREEQHQEHHPHDRDVVGLHENLQELLKTGDVSFHRVPYKPPTPAPGASDQRRDLSVYLIFKYQSH
jgi:hypothetical protein